jgi:RNA polymerase sigma-70 factor (ECF subfamily)
MSTVLAHEGCPAFSSVGWDHDGELVSLVSEYERSLYNFVVALVRDTDVALDCVQDTFLRAYEALKRGKSINSAWLYTVARNRAMDEFRRKRWMYSDSDALDYVPVYHTSDESVVVQSVLDRMTAMDREVLHLFVVAGFKTDEIGVIMGMNGTAIRQRLYRARERFRVIYGEQD